MLLALNISGDVYKRQLCISSTFCCDLSSGTYGCNLCITAFVIQFRIYHCLLYTSLRKKLLLLMNMQLLVTALPAVLVSVIVVMKETNGNMTKKVLFFMNMISYLELVLTQVLTVLSLMMVLLLKALVNIIKIKAGLMVDLIIGDSHLQTDVGIIMVYQHLQILVVLVILKFRCV